MERTVFAATTIAAAAAFSSAGPVLFDFEGTSQGRNITISVGDAESPIFEGRVFAGSIMHRVDDAMLTTYCIDPEQMAQKGVTNFEKVALGQGLWKRDSAVARTRTLAELADIAGPSIWTSNATTLSAAAFQVAAWEIVSDYDPTQGANSFDFGSGFFRSWGNDSVINAATSLLSQLGFNRADASGYNAYLHGSHQDFMGVVVPGPGAIAITAIGVPLLANRRRRGEDT